MGLLSTLYGMFLSAATVLFFNSAFPLSRGENAVFGIICMVASVSLYKRATKERIAEAGKDSKFETKIKEKISGVNK